MARIADVMSLRVLTVTPDETVQLAIARMLEENVGSVAVCEGNHLVGIFTERDVLRLAGEGADFRSLRIGDVMTRDLVTVAPDDDVVAAAALMQERRIRHLPVIQDGNVLGIVGIREVLRALVERLWSLRDEQARHAGHPLHTRLVRRLREEGAPGATSLRGVRGFSGAHAPHGDRLFRVRRRVPVVTTVVDRPDAIRRWFRVVDEVTDEAGLVTCEPVPTAAPRCRV